jgi:hypothetical protein
VFFIEFSIRQVHARFMRASCASHVGATISFVRMCLFVDRQRMNIALLAQFGSLLLLAALALIAQFAWQ